MGYPALKTVNHRVAGSSPAWGASYSRHLQEIDIYLIFNLRQLCAFSVVAGGRKYVKIYTVRSRFSIQRTPEEMQMISKKYSSTRKV